MRLRSEEAGPGEWIMQSEDHAAAGILGGRASGAPGMEHRTGDACCSSRRPRLILASVLGALLASDANSADCNALLGKAFDDAVVYEVADVQGTMALAALGNSKATV